MRLLWKGKDGGPESSVTGWWLVEWKSLFSIALLKFEGKSREAFHSHAFNSISWLLKGCLLEYAVTRGDSEPKIHRARKVWPILTWRDTFHRVDSVGTSWVLTFRGPWSQTWEEFLPQEGKYVTLTNGRVEV